MKKLAIGILVILCYNTSFGQQKEAAHWVVGNNLIDFNGGFARIKKTNVGVGRLSSTISDSLGNFLFHSNSGDIYDSLYFAVNGYNGQVRPEPTKTDHGFCFFVKKPGSSRYYYLFRANWYYSTQPLTYFIIDRNKRNGKGGLVLDPTPYDPTQPDKHFFGHSLKPLDACIGILQHANDKDFWVITHDSTNNCFYSFLLSAQGLDTVPVITCTGPSADSAVSSGVIIGSPDSERFAWRSGIDEQVLVYNFDRATGRPLNCILSHKFSNTKINKMTWDIFWSRGAGGFSPNSQVFYSQLDAGLGSVIQYDLSSNDSSIIASTGITVSVPDPPVGNMRNHKNNVNQCQIGMDGKMYIIINRGAQYLHVIDYPDVVGTGCNYRRRGFPGFLFVDEQLPTLNQTLLKNAYKLQAQASRPICINSGDTIELSAYGGSMDRFQWSPNIALSNDTIANPRCWVDTTTTYRVIGTSLGSGNIDTAFVTVRVVPPPQVSFNQDTIHVFGATDSVILRPDSTKDALVWKWSTGPVDSFLVVKETGSYALTVSNLGCTATDSIFVQYFKPNPFGGRDSLFFCQGDSVLISGEPGYAIYLWSDGDTNRTRWVKTTTQLTISYLDSNGKRSSFSDPVTITVAPVYQTNDFVRVCPEDSFTFKELNYGFNQQFKDTLTSIYTGCDSIITYTVDTLPRQFTNRVDLICPDDSVIFNGTTYFALDNYVETYTGINGCDSLVSVFLDTLSRQFTNDIVLVCPGDSFSFTGINYGLNDQFNDTLIGINSCDSIVTYRVDTIPRTYSNFSTSICGLSPITFGGQLITATGDYFDTLTNAQGCDSILKLTVSNVILDTNFINNSLCTFDTIGFTQAQKDSLNRQDTVQGIFGGCAELNLIRTTILFPNRIRDTVELCPPYVFRGQDVSEIDSIVDTSITAQVCPELLVTYFIKNRSDTINLQTDLCRGGKLNFNGRIVTTEGNYSDTLSNTFGCDSIVNLQVDFLPYPRSRDSIIVCEGNSFSWQGREVFQAGLYQDTVKTNKGCDSIVELALDVKQLPVIEFEPEVIICPGEFENVVYNYFAEVSTDIEVVGGNLITSTDTTIIVNWNRNSPEKAIRIIATDGIGCQSEIVREFQYIDSTEQFRNPIIDCPEIALEFQVPNVITPNNDGFNDQLIIPNLEFYQPLEITIYDRWGREIYSNKNYTNDWGSNAPAGTYYYQITYANQVVRGWVMVVRG